MNANLIILLCALLLSAFFSGMEIAFVSSSRLRHEVEKADGGGLANRIIGIFFSHSSSYISTMLVGNNIVNIIYTMMMARLIDPLLQGWFTGIGETAVVLIDTLVSTLVILLFGEFLPKTLFRLNANTTLRLLAVPTFIFYVLLYPISLFTSWLARTLMRLFGIRIPRNDTPTIYSKVDLDDMIESSISTTGSEAPDTEVQIFRNALEFSSLRVRDCMVPRNEIAAVDSDSTAADLLSRFVETGYSKILIYDGTIDNIIGYIHSSDMFGVATDAPLATLQLRELPIVPETAAAHKLMRTLMQQKKSLAVVVDEFGGTAGIVSLEDIMEELTGDIEDEHDTAHYVARQSAPDTYILSARLEITKVNELFNLDLPESDDYHTLSGLILQHYPSIPAVGQTVTLPSGDFEFRVLRASANKIDLVKLTVK